MRYQMESLGDNRQMNEIAFRAFKTCVKPFVGHGFGAIKPLEVLYQWTAKRMISEKEKVVCINGYRMNVRIENRIGGVAHQIIFNQEYEPLSTEVFKKIVRSGDVVVDVGANIGYYTLLAAKLVGKGGVVYSFEPEKSNYLNLIENIYLNRDLESAMIQVRQWAISDSSREATLYVSKTEAGAHSLESVRIKENPDSAIVTAVPLDDVVRESVRLVKVDTEGHEMSVLQGAKETLCRSKDIRLMIECWEGGLIFSGSSVAEFMGKLGELGFSDIRMIDEFQKKIVPATEREIQSYTNRHKLAVNIICGKEQMNELDI